MIREQISKNYLKGDPIRSVTELYVLSMNKKSVYLRFLKIKPASVIMRMQCSFVYDMIKEKRLFSIIKKENDS